MKRLKYAVMGSGSAGHALAAILSKTGHIVRMYDIDAFKIKALDAKRTITCTGEMTGEYPIELATLDPRVAIEDCDIIMVSALTCNNPDIAQKIAPYIHADQIIVLNPGATCGALEFRNTLMENGVTQCPIIAETQDLICTCRSNAPGSVNFTGIKREIALATIPAIEAVNVTKILSDFYPNFIPQKNVLYTSLGNLAPINHPGPTVLNITRVEEPGDFYFFKEGFTPSIGKVVEAMDQERMNIAKAFGLDVISVKEWLNITYQVEGANVFEAMRNTPAYANVLGPTSLDSRYIFEDLPSGLIPMTMLGKVVGVPTPAMDAIIELLHVMTGIDYSKRGRTLDKLGLSGKSVEEIIDIIS